MRHAFVAGMALTVLATFGCGDDEAGADDAGTSTDACVACQDAGPEPCADEGAVDCSSDALYVRTCADGVYGHASCVGERALCEGGACVPRTEFGSPSFSQCPETAMATVESLADKAGHFDSIATRVHLDPTLEAVSDVWLADGAGITEQSATIDDVHMRDLDANNGLWNALYLSSQAHRYAVTREPAVLATILTLLDGQRSRMEITGVPGLMARRYILPGTRGIECPTNPSAYEVDPTKEGNRWVQIRDDGCAWVVDHESGDWMETDHCVPARFAGSCFYDNTSQDEIVGHVVGLSSVVRLVDDDAARTTAAELLEAIALHMVRNDVGFVDWDGRKTEHGQIISPIMALSFVRVAAAASGNTELEGFYQDCLLQRGAESDPNCVPRLRLFLPLDDYLELTALYLGEDGCRSNWNNMSMTLASLHAWMQHEDDVVMLQRLQTVLDESIMRVDNARAMIVQQNPWYNFMWAANKALGPESDGHALTAVEEGTCTLRRFPASLARVAHSAADTHPADCTGRNDDVLTDGPLSPAERCSFHYLFWSNPYELEACEAEPAYLTQPATYLLPYWMGRHFGFIDEGT